MDTQETDSGKLYPMSVAKRIPETREGKIAFALRNGIAVWDVLAGCDIKGADDSSIRNPQPNDLSRILEMCRY